LDKRQQDDFDERVNSVLGAAHAVEIWNEDAGVLIQAAQENRREDLLSWIAARLGSDEVTKVVGRKVKPVWPKAVPFLLAPVHFENSLEIGRVGFVSFHPGALPRSSRGKVEQDMHDTCEGIRRMLRETGSALQEAACIWTPGPADGTSIGLAALAAATHHLLSKSLREYRRPIDFAATGVFCQQQQFQPVSAESFTLKLQAASYVGLRNILAIDGPELRAAATDSLLKQLSLRIAWIKPDSLDARKQVFSQLLTTGQVAREFDELEEAAKAVGLPLGDNYSLLLQFAARDLARIVSGPIEIERFSKPILGPIAEGRDANRHAAATEASLPVAADLRETSGVKNGHTTTTDAQLQWTKVLRKWNDPRQKTDLGLVLTHVIERRPSHRLAPGLRRLVARLDDQQLRADKAFDALEKAVSRERQKLYRPLDRIRERGELLAAVQPDQRRALIERLVQKGTQDARYLVLAIEGVTHWFEAGERSAATDRVSAQELREMMTDQLSSLPLPTDSLLHQRVLVEVEEKPAGKRIELPCEHQARASRVEVCRYPVTNAEYHCFRPAVSDDADGDLPVVGVSWYEAQSFAFWAGLELPLPHEWLSAAWPQGQRSPPQFDGPDRPNLARVNCFESSVSGPAALRSVRAADEAASRVETGRGLPQACRDMFGNAWEWTADWYDGGFQPPGPVRTDRLAYKLALGGSCQSAREAIRPEHGLPLPPTVRDPTVGFRCVKVVPR
jgi:hypothetical protein